MTFDLTVNHSSRGDTPGQVTPYTLISDGMTEVYLRDGQFFDKGGSVIEKDDVPEFVITDLERLSDAARREIGFGYWTAPKPAPAKAAPSGKPKAVQPE